MSSSSDPNPSPPLPNLQPAPTLQEIIKKLNNMFMDLSKAMYDPENASKLTPQSADKDGDSKPTAESDTPNPLDKACNELNYLIRSFEKLSGFETDLSEPLSTLEKNVNDILTDLTSTQANLDYVKEMIARNLTVLRSNIIKVKVRIPLQHQASSAASGGRYLQTTNASKNVGMLLDPYGADGIFESGTFLKEFEDHYSGLDDRQKLCLLSFAIFPENAVVKKRLLRFWWDGERLLLQQKEQNKCSVKEILQTFVDKGFIQPVIKRSRSQSTSYTMHPIIRCLVIRFAQKANFFSFDAKGYPNKEFCRSKKICLVKSKGPSWWSKNVPLPKEFVQKASSMEDEKTDLTVKSQGASGVSEKDPALEGVDPNAKPNQQGKDSKKDETPNQTVKSQGASGVSEKDPAQEGVDPNAKPNQQGKDSKKDETPNQTVKSQGSFEMSKKVPAQEEFDPNAKPNQGVKSPGPSWRSKSKKVPPQEEFDPNAKPTQGVKSPGPSWMSKSKKVPSQEEFDPNANPNQPVKSPRPSWWSKNVPSQEKLDPNVKPNQTVKSSEEIEKERIKQEKKRAAYLENLQTLFNVSKQFPDLPEELFSKMKNIGVLYLGRWERGSERHMEVENTGFLAGLKNMNKLRFFSLQGVSGISKLPKSLANLYNLRILDLRACQNLEELPKDVGSLKMLTHLDLSECYLLVNIPKQLSHLPRLKVLKGFVISKNSACSLDNLTRLKNLEKLSINVNNDDFSIYTEDTYQLFSRFEKLKKLKIAWGAGGEGKKLTNETDKTLDSEKSKKNGKNNRSRESKTQESEAPKSMVGKAIGKLKIRPWGGVHGEGSSKSVPKNKVAAPTENQGGVDQSQATGHGEANKQASDATPTKQVDKKDEKPQMKLRKLDLQCYPQREPPVWLVPEKLQSLERLYIRGGSLSEFSQMDKQWNVKILRLKYLLDVKMNWKEVQMQFPKLEYLEKVNCPQIAFCPCDANGVWEYKGSKKKPPTNSGESSPDTISA